MICCTVGSICQKKGMLARRVGRVACTSSVKKKFPKINTEINKYGKQKQKMNLNCCTELT